VEWPSTMPLSALDRLRIESSCDEALRSRLIKNPASVLAEYDIKVPEGVKIKIVEDNPQTHTIVLPPHVGHEFTLESIGQSQAASTWECTTCTPTSPICAGSLASLICVTQK
jgi:hypothetical protein